MRKIIALIIVMCATIEMAFTQPIKPTFDLGIKTYNPPVYVQNNVPIPGPRGPRGYQGQTLTVRDTVRLQPDLSKYALSEDIVSMDKEIGRSVGNIYTELDALRYHVNDLDSTYSVQLNNAQNNLAVHKLKNSGWTKILSGVGLQAVALGLVAFSETDIVTNCVQPIIMPINYSVTEYELRTTPAKWDMTACKPWHHHNGKLISPQITELIPKTVNKTTQIVFYDNYPCITERNKTAYQITAGILAGAGIALEVLGIIDLHDAKVIASSEGIGVAVRF